MSPDRRENYRKTLNNTQVSTYYSRMYGFAKGVDMGKQKIPVMPADLQGRLPQVIAEVFPHLLRVAVHAGTRILEYYGTQMQVILKEDESPVTPADEAAHEIIQTAVSQLLPHVPIVSEEGGLPSPEERAGWPRYFLVDPLDGTKGFINQDGQFTVNIAYMEHHIPVAGIIHVPLQGVTYFGAPGAGAYRFAAGQSVMEAIRTNSAIADTGPVVLQSNVDRTPRLDDFMCNRPHTRIRAGSSLKFCLLAEGTAQLFPCLHATWEWDTAAGHAILAAAGGTMSGVDGEPFVYGKPTLLNGWFVARA